MLAKLHFKKGDQAIVIAGKEKGKSGGLFLLQDMSGESSSWVVRIMERCFMKKILNILNFFISAGIKIRWRTSCPDDPEVKRI